MANSPTMNRGFWASHSNQRGKCRSLTDNIQTPVCSVPLYRLRKDCTKTRTWTEFWPNWLPKKRSQKAAYVLSVSTSEPADRSEWNRTGHKEVLCARLTRTVLHCCVPWKQFQSLLTEMIQNTKVYYSIIMSAGYSSDQHIREVRFFLC